MNPIFRLFEEKFVIALFKEKVLPYYPDFVDIKKIKINPHKNYIWEETYHVVLEFKTYFITREGKIKKLPIFCSAHSSEPRQNLYRGLKHLWDNGFSRGYLTVPHALFYSPRFKAAFYRGVKGKNFYQSFREKNREEIEKSIPKIAAWFVKLHGLPTKGVPNFNKENSRIRTAIPGADKILSLIGSRYPEHEKFFKKIYGRFIEKEEDFLKSTNRRWLVHGDAHPENVIEMGRHKVALIDFNDLCLSDFARDLGCFLQQFEYMAGKEINNPVFIAKMKKLLLDSYLSIAKIKPDDSFKERIDNYYNWTAARTATFLLLKSQPEPDNALFLIEKIKKET